jgi:hypothetical protein
MASGGLTCERLAQAVDMTEGAVLTTMTGGHYDGGVGEDTLVNCPFDPGVLTSIENVCPT